MLLVLRRFWIVLNVTYVELNFMKNIFRIKNRSHCLSFLNQFSSRAYALFCFDFIYLLTEWFTVNLSLVEGNNALGF